MPKKPPAPDPEDGNYFTYIVSNLCGGETNDVLSAQLNKCVKAVEYGGKATLTLRLSVENKKGKVQITDGSQVSIPNEKRVSRFHVGKGGVLQKRDPRQRELKFEDTEEEVEPDRKRAAANDRD